METRRREVQAHLQEELQLKAAEDLRENINKQEEAVARLEEQEIALGEEVKRRDKEVKQPNTTGRPGDNTFGELEVLRNEVHQMEDLRKKMADQIDLLKVEPLPPPRVSLLEPADSPTAKNQDRLLKIAGIASLGAFFLGLCGVSYSELRRRRIHSASDVTQGLGLRLVGTLPALPPHLRTVTPGAATAKDVFWQQRLTESVDALRTQLLHTAQTESLGIVMVTSALGGEGKTTLASHLASSLARAWRKTLLIDCDLRNPGAHRLFDVPLEPGFSEVLRGDVEFDDVVKPTPVGRLWMIPAGNWDSHAIQALAQEGVRSIFERLKEQYDFIIIDSSPVLPVADALSLGRHVDGVILSVLSEVSRMPTVQAAQQRLSSLGIRVLGAAMLGAREEVGDISYQYPRPTAR
jgi:succinoglycan biosynthesis transport protein ExoP